MYYWVLEALEILARVFAGGHKCALERVAPFPIQISMRLDL